MRILFAFIFILAGTALYCQPQEIDELILNAQYPEALSMIAEMEKQPGADRSMLANKKAEALIRLGNFDEAGTTLDDIIPNDEMSSAVRLSTYGFPYLNQGRYDVAEESLNKAISKFEAVNKNETLEAAQAISYLGLVYNASGSY